VDNQYGEHKSLKDIAKSVPTKHVLKKRVAYDPYSGHNQTGYIQPKDVVNPVACVPRALDHGKQKQGRGDSADDADDFHMGRHKGHFEHIGTDMVYRHEDEGDDFQLVGIDGESA
jgi:hypothetical protein